MRLPCLIALVGVCAGCEHLDSSTNSRGLTLKESAEVTTLGLPEFEGRLYFFQTTRGELRRTPQWKSSSDFPPLSPRKAEKAALHALQQIRPDVRQWWRDDISLREWGDDAWYYSVRFSRADVASAGLPSFIDVPVLMNGRALLPTQDSRK